MKRIYNINDEVAMTNDCHVTVDTCTNGPYNNIPRAPSVHIVFVFISDGEWN